MPTRELAVQPEIRENLKKLVAAHRGIKDEPLLLAVHYAPKQGQKNVNLFEIVDGFGAESIDSRRQMFQVSYGTTDGFPLKPGRELRLLLTNPKEWQVAVRSKWSAVRKLREAVRHHRASVLYKTKRGAELWSMLDA